jgi:hypothetical protein
MIFQSVRFISRVTFLALLMTCISRGSVAAVAVSAAPAESSVFYFWAVNKKTEEIAKKDAMAQCKKGAKNGKHSAKECQILLSAKGPGYLAFFHNENGSIGTGFSSDRQNAIDTAYQGCSKSGGSCPASAERVVTDGIEAERVPTGCAPKTHYKNCKYSCQSTSCVVRFENGCTMNVTVGQTSKLISSFNPASGQHEYHWEWVNDDACQTAAGL